MWQRHQKMWPLQISGWIIQYDNISLYCTLLRFFTWEVCTQKCYVHLKHSQWAPNRPKGFTHLKHRIVSKQLCTAKQCKRNNEWGKTMVEVQYKEIFASCFIVLTIWRGHISGRRCARSSTAWMKDRHLAKNVLYWLQFDKQKSFCVHPYSNNPFCTHVQEPFTFAERRLLFAKLCRC